MILNTEVVVARTDEKEDEEEIERKWLETN